MLKRIVVINVNPKIYDNEFFKRIKSYKNAEIIRVKDNKSEILKHISTASALVNCSSKFFDKEVFLKGKNLQWIHTGSAGIENFLFKEFIESNILFTNGKILQGPEIADHALGLILTFSRNLHLQIKRHNIKNRPIELKGKKSAVFGSGGIGYCIAERLNCCGMIVNTFSDELHPLNSFINEAFIYEELKKKISDYDVIVIASPSTNKSKEFFNYNLFKKMKMNSILINVSRGDIIKTEDLLKKNIFKKFRGIGLDVTNPEPLDKNHIFNKQNNIILTNHTAGLSDNNRIRSRELVEVNIKRFLMNENLLNTVNKQKGY
jgi:phosphoglycerate dehydrogenase-like enzyme